MGVMYIIFILVGLSLISWPIALYLALTNRNRLLRIEQILKSSANA
jgi:hypothetical protein